MLHTSILLLHEQLLFTIISSASAYKHVKYIYNKNLYFTR